MGMRLRGGTALADGVITASLAAQGLKTSASPTATGMVAQGAVDSRPQLNQSRRTAELAEFNRLSETALDGWPATPVHTNRGRVLERAALQPQILPVDGRREVKPAVVVGQLHLRPPNIEFGAGWIGQRRNSKETAHVEAGERRS